jgi:lysophospholipase L1-like esterase
MRSWFFAMALGLAVATGLVAAPTSAFAQGKDDFFFKKGDVVLVDGDSITEQRLYSNYLEMWSVTRFPDYKLVFRNVGVSGDTSPGGNRRLKTEIPLLKPTAMTVDLGMNDGRYTKEFVKGNFDTYMNGLQGMADQAKAAGIRVAWVTPQPTERGQPGKQLVEYNQVLEKLSEGVAEIAKKNDGLFVDQFHPYLAVIEKARATDEKIRITGGDAVHPGPPGQALMAASILKGLHFPKEVSSVSIDVAKSGATGINCTVDKLDVKDGVRFMRHDKALPFFPEQAKGILKWTPLLDDMNHYGLQVKNLPVGVYEIRLGGKKAAEYSAEDLATGVNLAAAALTAGPVADQAKGVVKAVNEKTAYFHDQIFRGVMLGGGPQRPAARKAAKDASADDLKALAAQNAAALKAWEVKAKEWNEKKPMILAERMAKMPEYDAAIHAASQPRAYLVEIVLSKGTTEKK